MTCNTILELVNWVKEGRHNFNVLHVKWSNFLNRPTEYNFTTFSGILGLLLKCDFFKIS